MCNARDDRPQQGARYYVAEAWATVTDVAFSSDGGVLSPSFGGKAVVVIKHTASLTLRARCGNGNDSGNQNSSENGRDRTAKDAKSAKSNGNNGKDGTAKDAKSAKSNGNNDKDRAAKDAKSNSNNDPPEG